MKKWKLFQKITVGQEISRSKIFADAPLQCTAKSIADWIFADTANVAGVHAHAQCSFQEWYFCSMSQQRVQLISLALRMASC